MYGLTEDDLKPAHEELVKMEHAVSQIIEDYYPHVEFE
jgi:hypothetical protein